MKDYLKMFQEGGQMGPAAGGGSPEDMLATIVQTQDPQLALEFCNQLAQQMGLTGGGAPGGEPAPAPAGEPAPAPAPMGRYGMKIPKIDLSK